MPVIKILSINTGRGKESTILAFHKIKVESIDIAFIQEPYHAFKFIVGYQTFKVNNNHKVLTLVRRGLGKVWLKRECCSENFVAVELEEKNNSSVLFVNVYDEPPDVRNTVSRFRDLSGWLQNRTERILVAGDFNGKNVIWGNNFSDNRGEEIHEWTVMNGWRVQCLWYQGLKKE